MRQKWQELDNIFNLAYTIREKVQEEKYYMGDKYHWTMLNQLEKCLGKCHMDNMGIDMNENYDLGQSQLNLAIYISETVGLLNTCAMKHGEEVGEQVFPKEVNTTYGVKNNLLQLQEMVELRNQEVIDLKACLNESRDHAVLLQFEEKQDELIQE